MQKRESKIIIGVLAVLIVVVYAVAFIQLGIAGDSAAPLQWVFTVGSVVAAIAGLLLLVDWRNLDKLVSEASPPEWAGLVLAVLSLALGLLA